MLEILSENVSLQHFMKLQSAADSRCIVMGYILSSRINEKAHIGAKLCNHQFILFDFRCIFGGFINVRNFLPTLPFENIL